jgi:hypothetical protein
MAWCVKGKYYDLSKFNHPGGPIALNLARGRDADALIREYHPFTEANVRTILEKYAVEKAETGMNGSLLAMAVDRQISLGSIIVADKTFKSQETPFANELRQLAQDHFQNGKIRVADAARWREYAVMLCVALTSLYFTVQVLSQISG